MLINTQLHDDGIAIVELSGRLKHASALHTMSHTVEQLKARGRRGLIIDLSRVTSANMAGAVSLIELISRHPDTDICLSNLPSNIDRLFKKSGIDRGLITFKDKETALKDEKFKGHTLSDTKAVLLCAGKGTRMAPLTDLKPKPMLDVAGLPTLHRLARHLNKFGLRELILNPGHLGEDIIDYFQHRDQRCLKVSFANERSKRSNFWESKPIGSASTLKRIQRERAAFDSDFFVLCGDALVDINLAEMMHLHRELGADVTIATQNVSRQSVGKYGIIEASSNNTVTRFVEKPSKGQTDSTLANTGIYIFKPELLDLIDDTDGLDIANDLLPAVLANGRKMRVYSEPFSWIDIGCGLDYAQAIECVLTGMAPGESPLGLQIRPGVWADETADVSSHAQFSGHCYVGENATIEAGASVEGSSSIGSGAVVEGGTLLRNSIVLPNTRVCSGAWVENMIISSDWAIDHTRADGSAQINTPIDFVVSTFDQLIQESEKSA